MKKDKYKIIGYGAVALLLTTMVISVPALYVSETIEPIYLGTILYEEYIYCDIENLNGEADIQILFSELNGTQALTFQNMGYLSIADITSFKIISNPVEINWRFTPDIKPFYIEDLNNPDNPIYVIYVDYSNVEIPATPYEEDYFELLEDYNILNDTYNNLTYEYQNLLHQNQILSLEILNITENLSNIQNLYNETEIKLNNTITNLTASFNETLNQTVTQYETKLSDLYEDYNETKNNLDKKITEYNTLQDDLTKTENILQEREDKYESMKQQAQNNTLMQLSYEALQQDYSTLQYELENARGGQLTWSMITAIVLLFAFFIYIFRNKILGKEIRNPTELERDTGYNQLSSVIDKTISKISKKPTEENKDKKQEVKD